MKNLYYKNHTTYPCIFRYAGIGYDIELIMIDYNL